VHGTGWSAAISTLDGGRRTADDRSGRLAEALDVRLSYDGEQLDLGPVARRRPQSPYARAPDARPRAAS